MINKCYREEGRNGNAEENDPASYTIVLERGAPTREIGRLSDIVRRANAWRLAQELFITGEYQFVSVTANADSANYPIHYEFAREGPIRQSLSYSH